jgi:adenylylsulfate kinase
VNKEAFAVWITGLPASGKSTLAGALKTLLDSRNIDAAVLESDVLREILTPETRYDEQERDRFYRQLVFIGALLVRHGVPVIFDATANRRSWRQAAKKEITKFIEVYVECPLEVCMLRDPKGIYHAARGTPAGTVPGIQAPYEPPENPDLVVHGEKEEPNAAAWRIFALLAEKKGYM